MERSILEGGMEALKDTHDFVQVLGCEGSYGSSGSSVMILMKDHFTSSVPSRMANDDGPDFRAET